MTSSNCFFLNRITNNDIQKGILRINIKNKVWFPQTDKILIIRFNGTEKSAELKKGGKFDVLVVGEDFMKALNVAPESKLKITRITEYEFLFENGAFLFSSKETDGIFYPQLVELKKKYWQALETHKFPKPPPTGNAIEMISYFKRQVTGTVHSIGPYTGLSVFEAANRIASDLVIITGVLQIIEKDKDLKHVPITVRLGNRHEINKGDFTINGKEGEAFNVASSFYKVKLNATNKKWPGFKLSYILVNAEIFDEMPSDLIDSKVIKVLNWDKP